MREECRVFFRSSLILSSLIVLSTCAHPTTYSPQVTPEELAAEEIAQRQMVDAVEAEGGMPKRWKRRSGMYKQFERVAERIEEAGARVCRELGIPRLERFELPGTGLLRPHVTPKRSCYYYFETTRDRDINAHADGDSIFVNYGLLRFIGSDDELAVVLGHEFSHNMMGHIDARKQNLLTGGLLGAAIDVIAASQGMSTGGSGSELGAETALSYSIPFEKEADYVGLYVAARAGYDIRTGPAFWRRMSIESPDNIYIAETHPTNPERFVALQKTIQEIDSKRRHGQRLLPELNEEVTNP